MTAHASMASHTGLFMPSNHQHGPRDPFRWRKLAVQAGITGPAICSDCLGSGVVPALFIDEIEYDTCMSCAHLFTGVVWPTDDEPNF